MVKEVTSHQMDSLSLYTTHINIGTEERGTAILTKEGLSLTQIRRLPSGRGMTVILKWIFSVNIYAPSGGGRKQKREYFYNTEVPYLLPVTQTDLILAGEFNSVL
jgi:hypothetical protein